MGYFKSYEKRDRVYSELCKKIIPKRKLDKLFRTIYDNYLDDKYIQSRLHHMQEEGKDKNSPVRQAILSRTYDTQKQKKPRRPKKSTKAEDDEIEKTLAELEEDAS
ncbi:MAG: hypothetical protein ACE5J7_02315 [Candidatus Aenigmatarchaeota archaeon]